MGSQTVQGLVVVAELPPHHLWTQSQRQLVNKATSGNRVAVHFLATQAAELVQHARVLLIRLGLPPQAVCLVNEMR